jgi:hypothetical protein
MLTVLEHHAEPLAASNTTFKMDTRDEQLEKAALRDPLQLPPNALARGSICPGSERPVRHCFPHHRFLSGLTYPEITESPALPKPLASRLGIHLYQCPLELQD